MKTVASEFIGKGEVKEILFRQVFRYKNICIYFRSDNHFEVIKIRVQETCSRLIKGKKINYQAKEVYPKAEKWGSHEKCCKELLSAVNAFNLLAYGLGYEFAIDMKKPCNSCLQTVLNEN